LIRDIKRHEGGITALFDDRIGNRTTGLRIDIRDDHARAMPGQRRGTGRTDTLRRTRHQRDLAPDVNQRLHALLRAQLWLIR
jgi:hypothetical protein